MKRKALVVLAALGMVALTIPASAHRYNRNDDGHVLRVVAYVVHSVGTGLEYWVMRPIHSLVSKPDIDIIAGHQARVGEQDTYYEWLHGDYTPSIGALQNQQKKAARTPTK